MPSAVMRFGRSPVISRSAKRIRPWVGAYSPVIMLKSVVLPAPLGPMRLAIIPASSTKSMALTAIRPPKALLTLRASRSAMLVAFLLCLLMEFRGAAGARKQPLGAEQHDDDQ